MTSYTHLSLVDREKIYRLHVDGISLTSIANTLGRSKSTISRELGRNSSPIGYLPDRAHYKASRRRFKLTCKIERFPELKKFVLDHLTIHKWSPEVISARLDWVAILL